MPPLAPPDLCCPCQSQQWSLPVLIVRGRLEPCCVRKLQGIRSTPKQGQGRVMLQLSLREGLTDNSLLLLLQGWHASGTLRSLSTLDLSHNTLTDKALHFLSEVAPQMKALCHLDLSNNYMQGLSQSRTEPLAQLLKNLDLVSFNGESNPWSPSAIMAISSVLASKRNLVSASFGTPVHSDCFERLRAAIVRNRRTRACLVIKRLLVQRWPMPVIERILTTMGLPYPGKTNYQPYPSQCRPAMRNLNKTEAGI